MNICVIGSGYVGLVTGTCFAEFGVDVTCVDKDEDRIAMLQSGKIPFYEPGLEEMMVKNTRDGRLHFTSDLQKGVCDALVVFIAVGTPSDSEGAADLSYVRDVAEAIGRCMNGYKVVVTKSTVPVGTGKLVDEWIRKNQCRHCSFDIASNPEFLREGSAIEDFIRPNRVVIGAESEQALAILKDLYRPLYLIETPFVISNVRTAEMIKYASNAFLATKITFINEMANLCELTGVDVHQVAKAMGLDKRIGSKFLHPGPGFGGSCFPKDTTALAHLAEKNNYDFKLLDAVRQVNLLQRSRMVSKIEKVAGSLSGKKIGFLGLTFKPNTDDIRESPAIYIIQELLERGAVIKAFDPAGMPNSRALLPDSVQFCENLYEAGKETDAIVIATEWNQFRSINWDRLKADTPSLKVIDLRNVYEPDQMKAAGIDYVCVGR